MCLDIIQIKALSGKKGLYQLYEKISLLLVRCSAIGIIQSVIIHPVTAGVKSPNLYVRFAIGCI